MLDRPLDVRLAPHSPLAAEPSSAARWTTSIPTRPLRVCHLAYSFYESDNRVMRYVQTLAARGDHIDVVSLGDAARPWRETSGRIRLYRIQRRSATERRPLTYLFKVLYFWVKASVLIAALQLRSRYDLVHVHNVPDFLVFAAWLPKLMGARIILDIHDLVPELYAGKFHRNRSSVLCRSLMAIEHACCSFADHVIVSNHLWHDKLITRSVLVRKCSVFLNYPDVDVFKPRPAAHKPEDAAFLVLYPGSLNYHQGVDIAVRAFALARPHMPGAVFHIYGCGPALTELRELTHALGVDASVFFMDMVSLNRIAAIMASASVGVVPKRDDGFGNEAFSTKILEFMACGVPVIASRTRIDEYYFDESLLCFFKAGNVKALAAALLRTYRNRNRMSPKVALARDFATQNAWQKRSQHYRWLVDSLVWEVSGHLREDRSHVTPRPRPSSSR